MSQTVQAMRPTRTGDKEKIFHTQATGLNLRVRNQLSKLLSPEFGVTVSDVAEVINILNVIKARCASLPEKFRLLVGLLCEVSLSVNNIEEHYEQLLIKNRIFHLLRMFPDVAHPLLDIIARATNQCCLLASQPVTIGIIEEERRAQNNSYGRDGVPATIRPGLVVSDATGLKTINAVLLAMAPSGLVSSYASNVPNSTQRLSALTPSVVQGPLGSNNGQPVVNGCPQPAAFDLSRKMYDQHRSLQLQGGALNPNGARGLPSDIQKRLLLQQQRHLRQQLEILQARRLQQSLTFQQSEATSKAAAPTSSSIFLNTTSDKMVSFGSASSPAIGPVSNFASQPMSTARNCSQIIQMTARSNEDVKAVDLRSPERIEASNRSTMEEASGGTLGLQQASKLLKVAEGDSRLGGTAAEGESIEEKKEGLLLSQVGRHCIMVSVRDGGTSRSQDCTVPEIPALPGKRKSEAASAKPHAKQKPKRGKSGQGASKRPVINVNRLCHVHDTRQSSISKKKNPSSPTNTPKWHWRVAANSHGPQTPQQDLAVITQCKDQPWDGITDSSNSNNNNCNVSNHNLGKKCEVPSKKSNLGKAMQETSVRVSKHADGHLIVQELQVSKRPDESLDPSNTPLDLSCTHTTTETTDAEFEPLTGLWRRNPDGGTKTGHLPIHHSHPSSQEAPGAKIQLSLEDTESALQLLHSNYEEEGWYNSSLGDQEDALSNEEPSAAGYLSNTAIEAPVMSGSPSGRHSFQGSTSVPTDSTCGNATALRTSRKPRRASKRKHPRTKSSKDKIKKKKKKKN